MVKINVVIPSESPVTTPLLAILATDGLVLVHVPPAPGLMVVVLPAQIPEGPVRAIAGLTPTLMAADVSDTQPVMVSVKINRASPGLSADTIPVLLIVATLLLVLTHTPPVAGAIDPLVPIHKLGEPVILATGLRFTAMSAWAIAEQPMVLVTVTL